ncbi:MULTISPECIES: DUF4193 domain-containing protein [unclassified Mycobacterium]|uniref:DUF4193 domain-containing protein n=1 Tax=unclassified Mycobacterium TaxID=2642494 RepID=UPI0008007EF1|nr:MULTISPECIES: DUF4193 domain-containing protein [unclassified Mycobacterium]OBG55475.1 cytochrome [Mycobacterium sp. E735]OBG65741.1 cytochrome [Mycobacterium sp. E188]OBG79707.1 cytochrome [Mycobacterium sp. E3298]OBG80926.1 cytochrome [Mycobacterium sp. E3305]OBH32108.1 cytochrome [Mycobacterium sp. E1715]
MATASDYDARRVSDMDTQDKSAIRELAPTLQGSVTAVVDEDPNDVHFFELPGADLSGEELSVTVIPQRSDEFTCSSCFLVQHRSRLRSTKAGLQICADCA